ncbi:MAG: dihydropyrimidinase, partial [Calditrichae bacterium]|nr:dihydropyrimidinase [Calditrichia bacterium]
SIDASGKLVFPGFIDAHTHMGIPIMDTISADDFESGSRAAAFGGVTTILDFTVQEKGQSLQEAVEIRCRKAQRKSYVDFSMHVNVTDQPKKWRSQIPALIEDGFISFKLFSTYRQAGMMITWEQFRQVMAEVNAHKGVLMLHAEDNDIVETQTELHLNQNQLAPIFHARSRPAEAEAKAIETAAEITRELSAQLYIVHLSSQAGLEAGIEARRKGTDIILETCPQYLLLTESQYHEPDGHYYITTPPLRTESDVNALWQAIQNGDINTIGTDHCPFTRSQKNAGKQQFHRTPNGLPGVETLFPLIYSYGVEEGRIDLHRLVDLLARNPARIFGIDHRKGEIEIGKDADLVIWNPKVKSVVSVDRQHGAADWSPYEGLRITGSLEYTIRRGQILVQEDKFVPDKAAGELIRGKVSD